MPLIISARGLSADESRSTSGDIREEDRLDSDNLSLPSPRRSLRDGVAGENERKVDRQLFE